MISTVTTTVSTIVSSSSVSILASLGAASVVTLIASLIVKELVTSQGTGMRLFGRNLDVIALPMLFVFSFIVSMQVWAVLA